MLTMKLLFFGKLYGTKQEDDLLCAVRGIRRTSAGVEVAKAYNEGSSKNFHSDSVRAILQMPQAAICLVLTVTEAIAEIMNEEGLEVVSKNKLLRSCDVSSAVPKNGCQVFKTFISFRFLGSFLSFLNENYKTIQIDTFYRVRDVCKRNKHLPVRKEISQYYELCVNACEQSKTIMEFMGGDLPEDFNSIEFNLLRTTMFHEKLMRNRGNAEIRPFLFRTFNRRRP